MTIGTGMERYLTDPPGIGGRLRAIAAHFRVEEVPFPALKGTGRNLMLVIELDNWETNRFVHMLGTRLGIRSDLISFAGLKDKRAVTVQQFSLRGMGEGGKNPILPSAKVAPVPSGPYSKVATVDRPGPENGVDPIAAFVQNKIDLNGVSVLDAFSTDSSLRPGGLVGNRFRIVVTDPDLVGQALEDEIARIQGQMEAVGGAPNFFGVQRFGAVRTNTHLVGLKVLNGDFMGAVDEYVGKPRQNEPDAIKEARAAHDRGDPPEDIMDMLPKEYSYERMLLSSLVQYPDEPRRAFERLPATLRRIFIQAVQAYVFNKILSARMEEGLLDPVVGDTVLPMDGRFPDRRRWIPVSDFNLPKIQEQCSRDKARVAGPLPGSDIPPMTGRPGEIHDAILEELGLTRESFLTPEMPEIGSKGRFRELVTPVQDLIFEPEPLPTFSFFLSKGVYATTIMREFMKVGDPMAY